MLARISFCVLCGMLSHPLSPSHATHMASAKGDYPCFIETKIINIYTILCVPLCASLFEACAKGVGG